MVTTTNFGSGLCQIFDFLQVKAQREAAGVRPKSKRRAKREAEEGLLASDEDSLSDAESEEIGEFWVLSRVQSRGVIPNN